MGINRGNKKLLEKLVEISKGKHVMCAVAVKQNIQLSVEPLNATQQSQSHTTSQLVSFRPKSLNLVVRKREIQQIEQENFKFAKRLFESHGDISLKDHKMDFKEHQKLVNNMQKLKKNQGGQKTMKGSRHGLLPPLASGPVNGSGKKQMIEEHDEGADSIDPPKEILSEKPTLSNVAATKESSTTQQANISERIINEGNIINNNNR